MLFLWRNHGCQLLQIAYHQELHTTERQIVALAILAKHRIYSIEQIAAHHTDFVDNEQVDTSDDIALELAELIAFLFAAAKGRAPWMYLRTMQHFQRNQSQPKNALRRKKR